MAEATMLSVSLTINDLGQAGCLRPTLLVCGLIAGYEFSLPLKDARKILSRGQIKRVNEMIKELREWGA